MSKVIDIDPNKRMKKEGLATVLKELNELDPTKLDSIMIYYQYENQYVSVIGGVDFGLLGYIDGCNNHLKNDLLHEFDVNEEDPEGA